MLLEDCLIRKVFKVHFKAKFSREGEGVNHFKSLPMWKITFIAK